jgi:hypothetical protein
VLSDDGNSFAGPWNATAPESFVAFATKRWRCARARAVLRVRDVPEGRCRGPLLRQLLTTQASVRHSASRVHSTDGVALCGKADGPFMPHVAARGPQQGATAVESQNPFTPSPIPREDPVLEIGLFHEAVVIDGEGIIGERSSSTPGSLTCAYKT